MKELLKYEYLKIFISKSFWIVLTAVLIMSAAYSADKIAWHKSQGFIVVDESNRPDPWIPLGTPYNRVMFLMSFSDYFTGLFISFLFVGLFVGSDFQRRTINKPVYAGFSRKKVIAAKLIVFSSVCLGVNLMQPLVVGLFLTREGLSTLSLSEILLLLRALGLKILIESAIYCTVSVWGLISGTTVKTMIIPIASFIVLARALSPSDRQEGIILIPDLPAMHLILIVGVSCAIIVAAAASAHILFSRRELK